MKLNKKIKDLTPQEQNKLNKILGECSIISFDPKKVLAKLNKAYNIRAKAHGLLLEADIMLDELYKDLTGETAKEDEHNKELTKILGNETKSMGKSVKNRKLGRKV